MNLFAKIKDLFWQIGVTLSFILFILFKARQSGKKSVENQEIADTLEGVKIRDKIENTILITPDDKLDRLRKKWTKD